MYSPYLTCHNLSASYGPKTLFENLSFAIHPGERFGIVGPNGAGKSTLFKLMKGTFTPLTGSISTRQNLRISFIDQKIDFDENLTVEEILRASLPFEYDTNKQKQNLEDEIDTLTHLMENTEDKRTQEKQVVQLSELHSKLFEISGASTDNIIQSALKLGFLGDLCDKKFHQLSGGQQKRVQIIASLLKNPQIILLDEPTNHLDIQTVEWLEEFLLKVAEEGFSSFGLSSNQEAQEPIAFLIISHDRALLDTLVNKILEIENGTARKYDGNYEQYSEQKVQYLVTEERTRLKMANTMRRELEWLRDGVRARTTKQTARIKRAHALDEKLQDKNQKTQGMQQSNLAFQADMMQQERDKDDGMVMKHLNLGHQELIKCEHLSIVHPSRPNYFLFKNLNFVIKPKMRIAILGPNGSGKSTLLKYIAEKKLPFAGRIKYHELCSISYFDQKRHFLDYSDTVKNNLLDSGDHVFFNGKYIHYLSYLDKFLFSKDDANKRVSALSGGEQARLLLAKLMLEQGNCLILDEPTNDLDIPTLQVLERNLANFDGGIIFTSHDRYFMQKVATNLITYVGEKENASEWTNFFDLNQALEYLETLEETKKQNSTKKITETKKIVEFSQKTYQKPSKNKWQISQLEKEIIYLEHQISLLNEELEMTYAMQKGYTESHQLLDKIKAIESQLNAAYQKLEQYL